MTGDDDDHDAGLATIVTCIAAMSLIAILVVALHIGAAVIARQRAENAADLAALAGAAAVLRGPDAACARAGQLAAANGASVTGCQMVDLDLRVQVAVSVRIGPIAASASGRARAGPVGVASG